MKVVKDYPPNYKEIIKAFPDVKDHPGVIFTYGDILYAPRHKGKIPKHLRVHEELHKWQQGPDPEGWWRAYCASPKFRLSQELAAYRKQYFWFTSHDHNIKKHAELLDQISTTLAGPIYGNIIDKKQAKELITKL